MAYRGDEPMSDWQNNCSDIDDDGLYHKVQIRRDGLVSTHHRSYYVHRKVKE